MATLTAQDDGTHLLEFQQGDLEVFHVNVYTDSSLTELADLTGYLARGMGRQRLGDVKSFPEKFSFSCSIVGSKVSSIITARASAAVTDIKTGWYDIEIYDPDDLDNVKTVLKGKWIMSQEATI